jgi:hypothetical protein
VVFTVEFEMGRSRGAKLCRRDSNLRFLGLTSLILMGSCSTLVTGLILSGEIPRETLAMFANQVFSSISYVLARALDEKELLDRIQGGQE